VSKFYVFVTDNFEIEVRDKSAIDFQNPGFFEEEVFSYISELDTDDASTVLRVMIDLRDKFSHLGVLSQEKVTGFLSSIGYSMDDPRLFK
jgi:hypothetical protein